MKSVDELIENGYVKVGSKSYCEYWKKGEEVITIPTDLECFEDGCMSNIKDYLIDENYNRCFWLHMKNGAVIWSYISQDVLDDPIGFFSERGWDVDPVNVEDILMVGDECSFDDDPTDYGGDAYDEEYELSKEDFAKLKSYEVSEDIYKYNSIKHLKEILTLLDNPYIDNLERDWNNEFHADLSKLKFDYGLICSYGYLDSWDELVNCCMIIDGVTIGSV